MTLSTASLVPLLTGLPPKAPEPQAMEPCRFIISHSLPGGWDDYRPERRRAFSAANAKQPRISSTVMRLASSRRLPHLRLPHLRWRLRRWQGRDARTDEATAQTVTPSGNQEGPTPPCAPIFDRPAPPFSTAVNIPTPESRCHRPLASATPQQADQGDRLAGRLW